MVGRCSPSVAFSSSHHGPVGLLKIDRMAGFGGEILELQVAPRPCGDVNGVCPPLQEAGISTLLLLTEKSSVVAGWETGGLCSTNPLRYTMGGYCIF